MPYHKQYHASEPQHKNMPSSFVWKEIMGNHGKCCGLCGVSVPLSLCGEHFSPSIMLPQKRGRPSLLRPDRPNFSYKKLVLPEQVFQYNCILEYTAILIVGQSKRGDKDWVYCHPHIICGFTTNQYVLNLHHTICSLDGAKIIRIIGLTKKNCKLSPQNWV